MWSISVVVNAGIVSILSEGFGFYLKLLDSCFRIGFQGYRYRAYYSGGSDVGGCYA